MTPFVRKVTALPLSQLPRDLDEDLSAVERFAPKKPMPDYVQHRENVDELGKISAEAIVQQYEAAAKQVEEMGNEIRESTKKLAAALAEHNEDMKLIAETVQAIRERGKTIFLQIEDASNITTELRATCVELKKKIER
jgi:methyl-accepting chemotaxis protein